MKFVAFAGLLCGIVAVSMAMKKAKPHPSVRPRESESLYAIDELLQEQEF